MNRIIQTCIAVFLSFLAGCTSQQIGQLIEKMPDYSAGAETTPTVTQGTSPDAQEISNEVEQIPSVNPEPSSAIGSASSQSLVVKPALVQIKPEKACFRHVQGKIAYDYQGNKRWNPANIKRLCNNTRRAREPAKCFRRVMHGGINWGGGTKWKWKNVIDLCEGTHNANRTIGCFQKRTHAANNWKKAIRVCETV